MCLSKTFFLSSVSRLHDCLSAPAFTFQGDMCRIGGRDSSVGIATRYGLEGPGIESQWGRDFLQLFRPALGPTQAPIQWVRGLFPGGKAAGA